MQFCIGQKDLCHIGLGVAAFIYGASCAASIPAKVSYINIDRTQRSFTMVSAFGKGMFPERITQNNIGLGAQLSKHIGIEGSVYVSESEKRTVLLTNDNITMGVKLFTGPGSSEGDFGISENSVRTRGFDANVVGNYPTNINKTDFIVKGGVNCQNIKLQYRPIADIDGNFSPSEISSKTRIFKTTRLVPAVSAGLQYRIVESVYFRVNVGYLFSSKFKNIAPINFPGFAFRLSIKNNSNVGLGFTGKF